MTLQLGVVLLAGCSNAPTQPPLTVTGQVEAYTHGAGEIILHRPASGGCGQPGDSTCPPDSIGSVLAVVPLSSTGNFTLTFPSSVPPGLLQGLVLSSCETTVNTSDPAARGFPVDLDWRSSNQAGKVVLLNGPPARNAEGYLQPSLARYWYVDRPVTIRGTCYASQYDLALQRGWNLIAEETRGGGARSYTVVSGAGFNYYAETTPTQ